MAAAHEGRRGSGLVAGEQGGAFASAQYDSRPSRCSTTTTHIKQPSILHEKSSDGEADTFKMSSQDAGQATMARKSAENHVGDERPWAGRTCITRCAIR